MQPPAEPEAAFLPGEPATAPLAAALNTTEEPAEAADAEEPAAAEEMVDNVITIKLKVKASGKNDVFSEKTFKDIGVSPELIAAAKGPGWGPKCTVVQEKAIPLLLSPARENLIAQAPSGNGKTATFTLALLQLIDWSVQQPQALVVSHNKDLTNQTCAEINKVIEHGRLTEKGLKRAIQIVNPSKLDDGLLPPDTVLGKTPLVGPSGGKIDFQIVCGPPKQVSKLTGRGGGKSIKTVSYTHLTLPTKRIV
eukprot:TRINITY_DN50729_c0_g1_i1.p1 TRINITY_DN50729_c0_g1~~TRINITY_DN50729_c0_g1_i1.p1  ORF type:complete len:251 (-),score=80.44 TRINITY_DN50729_c0_g1_i1:137-889(-)